MPTRHTKKTYVPDGIYHIFNRGTYKQTIFYDKKDYKAFLALTRKYVKRQKLSIFAYAVLPNHFHFLLQQSSKFSMANFMKSLCISYSFYFRKKYGISGRIFESTYKAVYLSSEKKIREAEQYILFNPLVANLENWPFKGKFLNNPRGSNPPLGDL